MRDASHAAIAYAVQQHARHDHETCPERLCAALGIRVIPGQENRAVDGPPSIITLRRDRYAPRQRFTMHHEIAHILIQRAGLEDAVLGEVDSDDAEGHLEAIASHIGAALLMPEPLVRASMRDWGDRPEVILSIQQGSGASFSAALLRYVTHDLQASRGHSPPAAAMWLTRPASTCARSTATAVFQTRAPASQRRRCSAFRTLPAP